MRKSYSTSKRDVEWWNSSRLNSVSRVLTGWTIHTTDGLRIDADISLFEYPCRTPPAVYRNLGDNDWIRDIEAVRAKYGDSVVVLVHHYQHREIVELADFMGDSY